MLELSTGRITKYLERADSEIEELEWLLRDILEESCPDSRREYLNTLGVEHLLTGGKRVRARLALAAAEALAVESDALPWAAACELLHNASLVHDDIQDQDATRRGQPAVWVRYGLGQAINLGDLMLMLPANAIKRLECTDSVRWRLMAAVARRAQSTVRAQAVELELRRNGALAFEQWQSVAAGKTGELFALPVEGAALLAGAATEIATSMGDVFRKAGVAYQLADDRADGADKNGAMPKLSERTTEAAAAERRERLRQIEVEIRTHPALKKEPRLKEVAVSIMEGLCSEERRRGLL